MIMDQLNSEKLKKILSHPQIYTLFDQQILEQTKRDINLVENDLHQGMTDGDRESRIKHLDHLTNFLLNLVISKPITPILKDLINELLILLHAWNENIGKDMKIRNNLYAIRKFTDYHLTMIDVLQSFKGLLKKAEQIQNFNPPAFEISQHYLKSLEAVAENDIPKKLEKKSSKDNNNNKNKKNKK